MHKQNERHIVPILPREIGDFDFRIKQKTLSYLYRRFLPPFETKIRFSFYNATLSENIISSKVSILFILPYFRDWFNFTQCYIEPQIAGEVFANISSKEVFIIFIYQRYSPLPI